VETNDKIFTLHITEEIKLNTVGVEGGFMSVLPAKIMFTSKSTGCKSIHPLIVSSEI